MILDYITQFREAMQLAGIRPPEVIYPDGRIHRFASSDKYKDNAGWYVLYSNGIPAGSFGDWRTGALQTWCANIGRPLTPKESLEYQRKIDTIRQLREVTKEERQANACKEANRIWNNAGEVSSQHPYLLKKGIKAYGIREYQGALAIPIGIEGVLYSLQFIRSDGNKRFLKDGRIKGSYFKIGNPNGIICVCEGYATGASIFAAVGYSVAVAFNAGNLAPVAKLLRQQFPKLPLIICADDDVETPGNPGLTKAREAASLVGGCLAIPDFGENRPQGMTDFNDLYQRYGIEAVKQIINQAKPVKDKVLVKNNMIKNQIELKLTCALDLKPEPIHWLWQDWLAIGKFHLLAGVPGTGKTTLALNLAAIITKGDKWPDGTHCMPGNVLIWSGEDNPQDTLLPRLLAHNVDQSRVYFVSGVQENNKARAFDPAIDLPKLHEKASQMGDVRFIIIDPVVNVVSCDSHKNGEVRRALQPLVELGDHLKAAILGISHFTKGTIGRDPLERVTGSIAFGALARVVLATAKVTAPNGDIKRLLVRAKSNHGPDGGGYHYQIQQIKLATEDTILASQIVWGEPIEGSAQELLMDNDHTIPEERSTLAEAVEFLRVLLAEGPLSRKEVDEKAKETGFKEMTLRRAKAFLGIKAVHEGHGKGSVWKWALPSKAFKDAKGAHLFMVSDINNPEHLLTDLTRIHPSVVEGCKLFDILLHADSEDYEELKKPEVLAWFARSLKDSGKIKEQSSR